MNYLERRSRRNIAYAVHQCAIFSTCSKKEHDESVRWLGRYFLLTRDKGTILTPQKDKHLDVYVDADFAGNFDKDETYSRDTARSRHGYIVMYK